LENQADVAAFYVFTPKWNLNLESRKVPGIPSRPLTGDREMTTPPPKRVSGGLNGEKELRVQLISMETGGTTPSPKSLRLVSNTRSTGPIEGNPKSSKMPQTTRIWVLLGANSLASLPSCLNSIT
jgi:hypothetical protein